MILVCGIPNAGKTTYSNKFNNVIHFDELNMTTRKRYNNIIHEVIKLNGDIVIDGVYCERRRRIELVNACKNNNIRCICVWLDTDQDICINREQDYRNRGNDIVWHYVNIFEKPSANEGWDEIIVIKNNEV